MKSKSAKLMRIIAIALLAALQMPLRLAALQNQGGGSKHHRYKLVDLGTFGGPTSWFCNDPNSSGGACAIQTGRGTVVSGADTSFPNPNYQNPSPFMPPTSVPGDPFIQHAFQWRGGTIQDLGVLPGGYSSWADAISANGLIAGLSENGAFDPLTGWPEVHAVLWKNNGHRMVDLGTLEGGYETSANGVNSGGQVIGEALNTIPDSFFVFPVQSRAFLWKSGTMQDLGTLGSGTDAFAFFVNESGQIAGASFTNTTVNPVTGFPTLDPFLWGNGAMQDLGTLGGTFGLPNALNNRGQVVGFSNIGGDANAHAFLWAKGKLTDLGTLNGASPPSSTASWINDAGEVVGGSYTPNAFHAVLWKNGTITDLGTVDGDACSGSLGVNSKGQVVGFSSVDCAVNTHAFLWENGRIIDLNTFNHSGSGLDQLLLAYNINDSGEIAGLGVPPGVDPKDVFTLGHTFVLIPCDDKHEGEGCANGRATDLTRSVPPQISQSPTTMMTQATLPGVRMNAIRAQPALRYPRRAFGTHQLK
jgi:probable HAF family extracellular repeat protein